MQLAVFHRYLAVISSVNYQNLNSDPTLHYQSIGAIKNNIVVELPMYAFNSTATLYHIDTYENRYY